MVSKIVTSDLLITYVFNIRGDVWIV